MEDAQTSFDNLVARYNEEVKNNKLKKQVEQLTTMLIKITKSPEVIGPVTSSVDEQVIK